MNKNNVMMSEKELDMVVGGWSREESENITRQLLENSDHTVVYNGMKIQIVKNDFEGGFADLAPNITKFLDSIEQFSPFMNSNKVMGGVCNRSIKVPCNEIEKNILIKVSKA